MNRSTAAVARRIVSSKRLHQRSFSVSIGATWRINTLDGGFLIRLRSPGIYNTKRNKTLVTKSSWAADQLEARGEILPEPPDREDILVTEKTMSDTPPHIKKLVDEMMSCNVLEIRKIFEILDVGFILIAQTSQVV